MMPTYRGWLITFTRDEHGLIATARRGDSIVVVSWANPPTFREVMSTIWEEIDHSMSFFGQPTGEVHAAEATASTT